MIEVRPRHELRAESQQAMSGLDIVLTATQPAEAAKIDAVPKWDLFDRPNFTMPFNVAGPSRGMPGDQIRKLLDRGRVSQRESQVRTGLPAGGRWIRTISPRHERAGFCCGRRIAGRTGAAKRVVSYAVPMVRIHLPPAGSPVRT